MKVALDATYSLGEQLTGIGVYSRELMHGLATRTGAEWLWCYRSNRFFAGRRLPPQPRVRVRPFFNSWTPACDIFHGLNQRLPKRTRARRMVATFHDLFVMTAGYSTPEFRERFAAQAREAASRADLVIAVSQFTADQVHSLLGVDRGRIRVVPHGVHPPDPMPTVPREPVILFAGTLQTRKNIARLVEAFERVPGPWRLVLAGSTGHGASEILRRIDSSPARARIEVTGWVTDEVLRMWLARASIFAFPSLDEGFGIPVLEAMAWGVPVVTSNRSALPEVAGGAALLADPLDTRSIADALLTLAESETERLRLQAAGWERTRLFPWSRAVEETWRVYGELSAP